VEENDVFGNFLSQAFQKPTNQNVSESKYALLDKQLLNLVSGKFIFPLSSFFLFLLQEFAC